MCIKRSARVSGQKCVAAYVCVCMYGVNVYCDILNEFVDTGCHDISHGHVL